MVSREEPKTKRPRVVSVASLVCMICKKNPKEVEWASFNTKNQPTGLWCGLHLKVVSQLYPDMLPDAVASLYHEDSEAGRSAHRVIDEATSNLQDGVEFTLPATLSSTASQGIRLVFEMAFLSEVDVVRLTGRSSKFLKLQEILLQPEQRGHPTLAGFLLSLRGLPMDEVLSLRRVQVYRDTALVLREDNLQPSGMLHESQPSVLLTFLSRKQTESYPKEFVGLQTRVVPPTLQQLQTRSAEFEQAAASVAGISEDEEVEELAEEDMTDVIMQTKATRGGGPGRIAVSTALSQVESTKKPKRKAKAAPKAGAWIADRARPPTTSEPAERRESSPARSVGRQSRVSQGSKASGLSKVKESAEIEGESQLDSEMARAQAKLGGNLQVCLLGLDVGRHLRGEKLGVRVAAAKKLLDRLSGGAKLLLENRISLCEKAASLAQGGAALSETALQQAVTLVTRANFELPVQVRMVLAERHAAHLWQEIKDVVLKARSKDEALRKLSQMDGFQSLVTMLIPAKSNAQEVDDVLRPTYANLISSFTDKHVQELGECELVDEPAMMEQHGEVWQALGDSLCSSFFTDGLCDLLSGGEATSHAVKFIFMKFLGLIVGLQDHELSWIPAGVQTGLKRIRHVAAAFVTLLDPMESTHHAGMDDVNFVKQDDSSHNIIVTTKSMLFGGNGFYSGLAEEMEKKAGSSRAVKGEYDEFLAALREEKEDKQDLDQALVKKIIIRMPVFMEKMREGATAELSSLLFRELRDAASKILATGKESEASRAPVSLSMISVLIKGLELFDKEKAAVELLHRLEKFKEGAGMCLGVQGFVEAVQRCVVWDQTPDNLRNLPIKDVAAALDNMGGLPASGAVDANLAEAVKQTCAESMPCMLQSMKLRVEDGTDIAKAEFTAINIIREQSGLNSDWWSLQIALLRECQIARGSEANYKSLGITATIRLQRDQKQQRLDQYAKSMLSMHRTIEESEDLEMKVKKENVKGALAKCCVRDTVKDTVFKQTHVLQAAVAAVFEGQIKDINDILAAMASHTQDLDLPATSWKLGIKDPKNADEVLEKAGNSIALLKGGLVQSDFKSLREAMTKLEQSVAKYGGLYEKNIIEGDGGAQAESMLADAAGRMASVKVLMLESCLHLGLATSNKAILTSQVAKISGGEVDESAVCEALLSKAREVLG